MWQRRPHDWRAPRALFKIADFSQGRRAFVDIRSEWFAVIVDNQPFADRPSGRPWKRMGTLLEYERAASAANAPFRLRAETSLGPDLLHWRRELVTLAKRRVRGGF